MGSEGKKSTATERKTHSLDQRASGILLHPSSLSNEFAIGDLGPSAYRFIDFLAEAGQHWWQMLPLSPIGPGNSPYQSFSSFAANTLLISPDQLVADGWLEASQLDLFKGREAVRVDYDKANTSKEHCLKLAFDRFESMAKNTDHDALDAFIHDQRSWLPDFSLFLALRSHHEGAWWTWEKDIRHRTQAALAAAERRLRRDIRYHQFTQWQFARQWEMLRHYGSEKGVGLIGDLPIFVSADSADVWAHPKLFKLKSDGSPAVVAGVPPDYFAATGQRWGNPHYQWSEMKKQGYSWWIDRFKTVLRYFDAVRIDHFIGFTRYYEIPASAPTAEKGTYKPGPKADFFKTVLKKLGPQGQGALIAEDLGNLTDEVKALRDEFNLPGMKVLQFAFGGDPEARNYQPHNFIKHCVVYTGTHDNNTTLGWYLEEAVPNHDEADFVRRYLNSDAHDVSWDMIRIALGSIGNTVIVPVQDVLGLGSESRMNTPGTPTGNWEWRLPSESLTPEIAKRLRGLSDTYQRV